MKNKPLPKGPISWMVQNHVAANLLMIVLLVGGLIVGSQVRQEVFPEFDLDIIRVSVAYPGASPAEVEQGIVLAIEDEVRGLDDIKKVTSTSLEGIGSVNIELLSGADSSKLLQDVKNAVDSILSLPGEAERPIVSLVTARRQVISLIIHGDQDETTLRALADKVRDDLLNLPEISLVELEAIRPLEIGIEIPQRLLRSYNLTLNQIADTVRRTSVELPAGEVKAEGGEVLLRTQERRDYASEFGNIPILSTPDGTQVLLRDIALIQDGFEETDQSAFFNGKRAVRVDVYRSGNQTPITISKSVRAYAEKLNSTLPEGVSISPWEDRSEIFVQRIELLLRNAFIGLSLVLLLLGLFLEPKLAFWVTVGIPISIVGSFLFIPFTDASINMISLFAFIVTLGIIVDDAVVVGEMVYQKREQGLSALQAAIEGAREIASPVVFAVLTNIAAFTPLFFVPGTAGKLFLQIPAVVVSVLLISLVESLYVLPAHLGHARRSGGAIWTILGVPNRAFSKLLKLFIDHVYAPIVRLATRFRYVTLAIACGILVIAIGFVGGGHVEFSYLPKVDSDVVTAQVVLPFGIREAKSIKVQERLVEAAKQVIESQGLKDAVRGIYTQIGSPLRGGGPATASVLGQVGSHLVGVQVLLVSAEKREMSGIGFSNLWRTAVGPIPEAEVVSFNATIGAGGGAPIDVELSHKTPKVLEAAARELALAYEEYTGVSDIDDGTSAGKPQMSFRIKPEARSLGIKPGELARQVRNAFYGAEALRQQRGRDEVKVLVRLPKVERERIATVEELILRTPDGGEIPLMEAVNVELGRSYTDIKRLRGRRILSVSAEVDDTVANANQIVADLEKNVLPDLLEKYPGLTYSLGGEQESQRDSLQALGLGFIFAMIVIYGLLAIPFSSYLQPLIVMISIPFGVVGAVFGHIFLGFELSIMSMFGIIALSGVVVNDSLVLVVTANRLKEKGKSTYDAIIEAGKVRYRPIVLTSLTTFFGLAPIIFEKSLQARFLIPMAISLGFGILFTTFIILLITPSVYLIVDDLQQAGK